MTVRERIELQEGQILSPRAMLAKNSRGRERSDEPCPIRTVFQVDRDRIVHCKSFRRLKYKTQVFLAPGGDHYRTRLTHTLEVDQIARTISRALQLNEDLTEAIALGHDLGHTPFGHAGERALDEVCPFGFKHYEQSVRVVELLEKSGQGLNLTWEVKNGLWRHTKEELPTTAEGRVVRLSDRIAYINHDIDDAIRAGVLSENDIPKHIRQLLGNRRSIRIGRLVRSVVEHSDNEIKMDEQTARIFDELHAFMFERVYFNPIAKSEEGKAQDLIKRLYEYFVSHPHKLPAEYQIIFEREGIHRAALDYIAGMSDRFALAVYDDLFVPRGWGV